MPTLGQPDASIYSDIQLPKPLNIGGDQPAGRVAGPNAAMARLASEQQKDSQIQQLAQQYLGDPANPDYDGMVKAVTAVDPERGLKMQQTLSEARKTEAQNRLAQTESSLKSMTWVEDGVKLAIQDPTQYPKLLQSLAKQPGGSQFLQYAPDPNDPDLKAKLQNLLPVFVDTKDFQKVSQQSYRDYLNGDLELSAVRKLAAADTPDKRQLVDSELKGAGLSDYSKQYPDAASASQAFTALLAQKQQEKPGTEKGGQAKEGIYQGKRTFGVFDPNTNTFNVDGKQVSATEFRPIAPQAAGGSAGGSMETPTIKPGTALYRTAQDLAYGKLTFSQLRSLMSYNRNSGQKIALYDMARQLNPQFNPAQFEMGYKYAGNPKTQNTLVSIDNALSNFDKAVDVSNALDRTDLPSINRLLASGKFQFGNKPVTNFQQLQTILGDDIALAIGQGAPSDYKTKLAQSLLNGNLSKENFISTLRQAGDFLQNRKQSILKQEGIYGTPEFNPSAAAVVPKVMGGGSGTVQQWKRDASGKLVPQ